MKVLLDTNVLMDQCAVRQPRYAQARELWELNKTGRITAFISSSSFTDLFYICSKTVGLKQARASIELCLGHLEICNVRRDELELAAGLKGEDFEDNLQIICAEAYKLQAIVSRDTTGFKDSPIEVLTPIEILARLNLQSKQE